MAKVVDGKIIIGSGSSCQSVPLGSAQRWYDQEMKNIAAWANNNPFRRNLIELKEFLDNPAPHRPTWAETFLKIADVLSERGTCPRLKTGAVVTGADNSLLAACYNGAPRGVRHCTEAGCMLHDNHCVRAIHAEQNAVLNAVAIKPGAPMKLYCTHRPCIVCARLILQHNFTEVNYSHDYDSDGMKGFVLQLFTEKSIGIRRVSRDVRGPGVPVGPAGLPDEGEPAAVG